MNLKIPNILTIGRIIIVPIFVLSFYLPGIVGDLVPFFLLMGSPARGGDGGAALARGGARPREATLADGKAQRRVCRRPMQPANHAVVVSRRKHFLARVKLRLVRLDHAFAKVVEGNDGAANGGAGDGGGCGGATSATISAS